MYAKPYKFYHIISVLYNYDIQISLQTNKNSMDDNLQLDIPTSFMHEVTESLTD